ncbi:MAG: 50S ribosomal protein L35 [Candidatus Omnitrophica bacterium]|nr:50S ribosomal protein L35 [Candidatus Omnitrophota bacterium]HPM43259.1 50S ribosomal protein L35 [Candidatus Omnitrophota bacterium]
MPKLKSNRSVRKRMRVTKSGKIKHFKATKGHLLTTKNANRKRRLRRPTYVSSAEKKIMKLLLPYGA